jgi:hypothetical protein
LERAQGLVVVTSFGMHMAGAFLRESLLSLLI